MKKLFFAVSIAMAQALTASTFINQENIGEDYNLFDFQAGDCLELNCYLENELFDATLAKLKCSFTNNIYVAFGDSDTDGLLFSYDKNEWFTLVEIIQQNPEGFRVTKCSGFPLF